MSTFILARETSRGELPGVPIAIVRSHDPRLNDLFLCVLPPPDEVEIERVRTGKKFKTDKKADVSESISSKPWAEVAATRYTYSDKGRLHDKDKAGSKRKRDADDSKDDEDPGEKDEEEEDKTRSAVQSKPETFIKLSGGSHFEMLPDMEEGEHGRFRTTWYTAGRGGSGKSQFDAGVLLRFHKLNPHIPIYGICHTKLADDPAYSAIPIKQLPISELMGQGKKFDVKAWFGDTGCMILADDWDSLEGKEKAAVKHVINEVLKVGRKLNISICITSHLLTNYQETRGITNECTYITVFPRAALRDQINLMGRKTGVPQEVLDRFQSKGAWVTIRTSKPTFVLSETEAEMI